MRADFRVPIGSSLVAASLPGIEQIRGVVIDNPSGQWLNLQPANDYIRPYTLGYARTFPGGITSVTITPGNGPAGQVSTQQGDPVIVQLNSDEVGTSLGDDSGAAFVQGFTPILTAQVSFTLISTGPSGTFLLIAGVANKRIRVHSVDLSLLRPDLGDSQLQQSPMELRLLDDTTNVYLGATITPETPSVSRVYPQGMDIAIGENLHVGGSAFWADSQAIVTATYSVI